MKFSFTFCLLLFLFIGIERVYAQFADSLKILVGTSATVASQDYQPLWLMANRFGTITDQKADLTTHIRLSNKHVFSASNPYNYTGYNKKSYIALDYGIDLYNNNHFQQVFLEEGFVGFTYNKLTLRAGRYEEIIGEVHPELSSGSLGGISRNALPVPKISIAITDYVDVPFTNGWVQFKGLFGHGWMGSHRLMKEAFLHEKSFYVRVGKNKLKLYGGLEHFGIWGGKKNHKFELDRSFKGFMNVVLVKEADDGSVGRFHSDKPPNRAGFQRGSVDGGLSYEFDQFIFNFYTQTPIETGTSVTFKNIDRLAGISLDTKNNNAVIKSMLLEVLYTKQMSDFKGAKEPYFYYENGVYQTGWDYLGRVMGTPLFIDRTRGSKYFEGMEEPVWKPAGKYAMNYNMPSNRVIALHAGVSYQPNRKLSGKTLLTFSRNYGNKNSKEYFAPFKDQWYSLQHVSFQPSPALSLNADLGLDWGELSDNFGLMLGLEWHIRNKNYNYRNH